MKQAVSLFCFGLLAIALEAAPVNNCTSQNDPDLIFIALEEHYQPPIFDQLPNNQVFQISYGIGIGQSPPGGKEITGLRLDTMNNNSVRMEAISISINILALNRTDIITTANNQLFQAIAPFPDRFRGLCYLPMAFPQEAAAELERCLTDLNFVGVLVDSHLANGSHYDGPQYDVLWETIQRHDVPFYMHPTTPLLSDLTLAGGRYTPEGSNFSLHSAGELATGGWGWHTDTAIAFARFWMSGVFDRFPNLKMVLGHMGELVPYFLPRIDNEISHTKNRGKSVFDVWEQNIWTTTSGPTDPRTFRAMLEFTSVDRVMYAADFPFHPYSEATALMEEIKWSGLVDRDGWEKIAYRNAEALLKLNKATKEVSTEL